MQAISSDFTARRRFLLGAGGMALLAACAAPVEEAPPEEVIDGIPLSQIVEGYGPLADERHPLGPVPPGYLVGVNRRAHGRYLGDAPVGAIEIDAHAKLLYWIEGGGTAWRYSIAVGRQGRGMRGTTTVQRKEEWPSWTPTANMVRAEPQIYGQFAGGVPGGPANPLGARALYLYRGGRDTMYRIHGTNDWSSIGNSGSAGCIRLFNHDIIHLFPRVQMGAPVLLRSREDSIRIEGEALANRGIELPAYFASRESIEDGTAGQRPPVPEAMMNEDGTYPPEIQAQLALNGATDILAETAGTLAPVDAMALAGG
ncbi:MAG: L,D-transpeptidase [Rubellimicrobium sp.]|nr:L,D-transpeptidase [Rubellimicrobium sp.]